MNNTSCDAKATLTKIPDIFHAILFQTMIDKKKAFLFQYLNTDEPINKNTHYFFLNLAPCMSLCCPFVTLTHNTTQLLISRQLCESGETTSTFYFDVISLKKKPNEQKKKNHCFLVENSMQVKC